MIARSGAYILDPFRAEKRLVYAVAVELWDGRSWSADIHYVQAHTAAEARQLFLNTRPGVGRFVAVAPAVGFYNDDTGSYYSADPFDAATDTPAARGLEFDSAA